MQSIQIDGAAYLKLTEQALAAGFADVSAYVESLAEQAEFDTRCGMTNAALRQSAEECNAILQRMESTGEGRDFREAWKSLGASLALRPSSDLSSCHHKRSSEPSE